jgi:hypothetical protein
MLKNKTISALLTPQFLSARFCLWQVNNINAIKMDVPLVDTSFRSTMVIGTKMGVQLVVANYDCPKYFPDQTVKLKNQTTPDQKVILKNQYFLSFKRLL